jgi:uncharacterized protein (TIGR02271 family)
MANTVIGLFDEASDARRAVQELTAAGFDRDRIDITTADVSGDLDHGADRAGESYGNEGFTDKIGNFFTSLFGDDESDRAGYYSEAMSRGGTLVTVHADSRELAERAAGVLDAAGAVDVDERVAQYQTAAGGERAGAGRRGAAIPVIEEELRVGKREVEGGGVRVRSRVVERPVEESVRLREEHVRVERRPVNRAVTEGDADAFREGTFELTERAEVPVVAKEARVVEEVAIGKEVEEHTETVRDTVRKTDVEVEQLEPRELKRGRASGK